MKRLIEFKYIENEYALEENSKVLFTIKKDDLKFDSLSFYKNIYEPKGSSADIELVKTIPTDLIGEDKRIAEHVFNCLNEIILNIGSELIEKDN